MSLLELDCKLARNLNPSLILVISLVILVSLSASAMTQTPSIPAWIKNNAKWWSEGQIKDSDFTKGIQYLINQGIMKISEAKPSSSQSQGIPSWIKNNAKWWSEGQIDDSEFVKGIQYLVSNGVIVVETVQCDQILWEHVYHPQRLNIIDLCTQVTGTIENIRAEKDGDYHIRLALDPKYHDMINQANVDQQHGDIVLETICQNPIEQVDAVASCQDFIDNIDIPPVGTHVKVTGSYVFDLEHSSWAEIHPVSSIEVILQNGTTISASNTGATVQNNPASKQNSTIGTLHIDLAEQDYIARGSIQSMTVEVTDGTNPVSDAPVSVHVIYASGNTTKDFTGTTDSDGAFELSWKIGGNSKPGTFEVDIDASKEGFSPAHQTFWFEVVPAS
ncbi:MAG: hypothetical protein AUG16_03050 [Thaumarchaeota archaeon 13_1_20CM_2_39_20]|nr:MAG: hypothetical protein AUG16_03050 [Thaumarchaeota archaeon 13_1_20CM_2_39_20]